MSLEHYQREMRRLLCESPELWDSASDYARLVARSHGLRLARQIVHEIVDRLQLSGERIGKDLNEPSLGLAGEEADTELTRRLQIGR